MSHHVEPWCAWKGKLIVGKNSLGDATLISHGLQYIPPIGHRLVLESTGSADNVLPMVLSCAKCTPLSLHKPTSLPRSTITVTTITAKTTKFKRLVTELADCSTPRVLCGYLRSPGGVRTEVVLLPQCSTARAWGLSMPPQNETGNSAGSNNEATVLSLPTAVCHRLFVVFVSSASPQQMLKNVSILAENLSKKSAVRCCNNVSLQTEDMVTSVTTPEEHVLMEKCMNNPGIAEQTLSSNTVNSGQTDLSKKHSGACVNKRIELDEAKSGQNQLKIATNVELDEAKSSQVFPVTHKPSSERTQVNASSSCCMKKNTDEMNVSFTSSNSCILPCVTKNKDLLKQSSVVNIQEEMKESNSLSKYQGAVSNAVKSCNIVKHKDREDKFVKDSSVSLSRSKRASPHKESGVERGNTDLVVHPEQQAENAPDKLDAPRLKHHANTVKKSKCSVGRMIKSKHGISDDGSEIDANMSKCDNFAGCKRVNKSAAADVGTDVGDITAKNCANTSYNKSVQKASKRCVCCYAKQHKDSQTSRVSTQTTDRHHSKHCGVHQKSISSKCCKRSEVHHRATCSRYARRSTKIGKVVGKSIVGRAVQRKSPKEASESGKAKDTFEEGKRCELNEAFVKTGSKDVSHHLKCKEKCSNKPSGVEHEHNHGNSCKLSVHATKPVGISVCKLPDKGRPASGDNRDDKEESKTVPHTQLVLCSDSTTSDGSRRTSSERSKSYSSRSGGNVKAGRRSSSSSRRSQDVLKATKAIDTRKHGIIKASKSSVDFNSNVPEESIAVDANKKKKSAELVSPIKDNALSIQPRVTVVNKYDSLQSESNKPEAVKHEVSDTKPVCNAKLSDHEEKLIRPVVDKSVKYQFEEAVNNKENSLKSNKYSTSRDILSSAERKKHCNPAKNKPNITDAQPENKLKHESKSCLNFPCIGKLFKSQSEMKPNYFDPSELEKCDFAFATKELMTDLQDNDQLRSILASCNFKNDLLRTELSIVKALAGMNIPEDKLDLIKNKFLRLLCLLSPQIKIPRVEQCTVDSHKSHTSSLGKPASHIKNTIGVYNKLIESIETENVNKLCDYLVKKSEPSVDHENNEDGMEGSESLPQSKSDISRLCLTKGVGKIYHLVERLAGKRKEESSLSTIVELSPAKKSKHKHDSRVNVLANLSQKRTDENSLLNDFDDLIETTESARFGDVDTSWEVCSDHGVKKRLRRCANAYLKQSMATPSRTFEVIRHSVQSQDCLDEPLDLSLRGDSASAASAKSINDQDEDFNALADADILECNLPSHQVEQSYLMDRFMETMGVGEYVNDLSEELPSLDNESVLRNFSRSSVEEPNVSAALSDVTAQSVASSRVDKRSLLEVTDGLLSLKASLPSKPSALEGLIPGVTISNNDGRCSQVNDLVEVIPDVVLGNITDACNCSLPLITDQPPSDLDSGFSKESFTHCNPVASNLSSDVSSEIHEENRAGGSTYINCMTEMDRNIVAQYTALQNQDKDIQEGIQILCSLMRKQAIDLATLNPRTFSIDQYILQQLSKLHGVPQTAEGGFFRSLCKIQPSFTMSHCDGPDVLKDHFPRSNFVGPTALENRRSAVCQESLAGVAHPSANIAFPGDTSINKANNSRSIRNEVATPPLLSKPPVHPSPSLQHREFLQAVAEELSLWQCTHFQDLGDLVQACEERVDEDHFETSKYASIFMPSAEELAQFKRLLARLRLFYAPAPSLLGDGGHLLVSSSALPVLLHGADAATIMPLLTRRNVSVYSYSSAASLTPTGVTPRLQLGCLLLLHHTALLDTTCGTLLTNLAQENGERGSPYNVVVIGKPTLRKCLAMSLKTPSSVLEAKVIAVIKTNLELLQSLTSWGLVRVVMGGVTDSPTCLPALHRALLYLHRGVAMITGCRVVNKRETGATAGSSLFYRTVTVGSLCSGLSTAAPLSISASIRPASALSRSPSPILDPQCTRSHQMPSLERQISVGLQQLQQRRLEQQHAISLSPGSTSKSHSTSLPGRRSFEDASELQSPSISSCVESPYDLLPQSSYKLKGCDDYGNFITPAPPSPPITGSSSDPNSIPASMKYNKSSSKYGQFLNPGAKNSEEVLDSFQDLKQLQRKQVKVEDKCVPSPAKKLKSELFSTELNETLLFEMEDDHCEAGKNDMETTPILPSGYIASELREAQKVESSVMRSHETPHMPAAPTQWSTTSPVRATHEQDSEEIVLK